VYIVTAQTSTWAIIDKDFATIALANSFWADNNGYVAGGTASGAPILYLTSDGGSTFTEANLVGQNHAAFLSVDMYSSSVGIAGALGFFGLFACGAYTQDGQNWNATHSDLICAIQDCQAIDENNMVLVGVWSDAGDFQGNGIQLSTDGGSTWKQQNWPYSPDARYAWFESSDMGYVAGGDFPSTSDVTRFIDYPLNHRITLNRRTHEYKVNTEEFGNKMISGYSGILASVTNGGSDWNVLLNITGEGLYFNEISCTDVNNCWLCAEGIDNKTGSDIAYIYHTNNGWQTYDVQLSVPGGSLITVSMLTPTFGWAGGALLQSTDADYEGQFWLTTDGQTWTLDQTLANFYVFYLSTTSQQYAYASGIAPVGLSSFASYAPSNSA